MAEAPRGRHEGSEEVRPGEYSEGVRASSAGESRRVAERTCVGCREVAPQDGLVRFAIAPHPPFIAPDPARKLGGRGASVHPRRACLKRAIERGGFSRAARRSISLDVDQVASMLAAHYEQRADSLLVSAHRRRLLALGTDAVREAMRAGGISLLVVANDAAGRRQEIETAAARLGHRCAVHGDKAKLGRLLGKSEVGVVALLDDGIAGAFWQQASRLRALREDDK